MGAWNKVAKNGEEDFVFLAASLLATSGSAAKTLFRAPTIPTATQATLEVMSSSSQNAELSTNKYK